MTLSKPNQTRAMLSAEMPLQSETNAMPVARPGLATASLTAKLLDPGADKTPVGPVSRPIEKEAKPPTGFDEICDGEVSHTEYSPDLGVVAEEHTRAAVSVQEAVDVGPFLVKRDGRDVYWVLFG